MCVCLLGRYIYCSPQRHLFQMTAFTSETTTPRDKSATSTWWFPEWSRYRYSTLAGIAFALFLYVARRVGCVRDGKRPLDLRSRDLDDHLPSSSTNNEDGGLCWTSRTKPGRRSRSESNSKKIPPDSFIHGFISSTRSKLSHFYYNQKQQQSGSLSKITCSQFTALSLTGIGLFGLLVSIIMLFYLVHYACVNQQVYSLMNCVLIETLSGDVFGVEFVRSNFIHNSSHKNVSNTTGSSSSSSSRGQHLIQEGSPSY